MTQKGPRLALAALCLVAGGPAMAQGYSLLTGQGLATAREFPAIEAPQDEAGPPPDAIAAPAPDADPGDGSYRQAALGASPPSPSAFGRGDGGFFQARAEIADTEAAEEARGRAQSLFIGQASHGFFAPYAPRERHAPGGSGGMRAYAPVLAGEDQLVLLRSLIAGAEAGRDGYDAVQHGARRKPADRPTEMTLGDIFAWIKATPGQPHAIGRYQFIPSTLARLVTILDAGPNERFSPQMQDRLADILLQDAGYDAFRTGQMGRTAFMNNLAKIWAGLPNSSGRSHYHGYAGNAATMSWANFDSEMARIFQG